MNPRAFAVSVSLVSWALLACGDGSVDDEDPTSGEPVAVAGTGGSADTTRGGASGAGAGGVTSSAGGDSSGGASAGGSAGDEGLGGGGDDTVPAAVFCDAPRKVLTASCGNGSCHSNANATIGDFAVDAEHAAKMVNRPSARNAECGLIIDPNNYSQSFLLLKVRGDFEIPKCGERMPIGSFVITEEQIDCLASWLQQFQL